MKTQPVSGRLKQGTHADPLDPRCPKPDLSTFPAWQRAANSAELQQFRAALMLDGAADVRESVLDDLSSFYGMTKDECIERCINWEQWSVEEWQAQRRDTPEGLANFYHTMQSWSFDLLWNAYLQAEGYAYPESVVIARSAPRNRPGLRHLDFGSGVGITSQLFERLGYTSDLADISLSLLEFARFRYRRRSQDAVFIDLNTTGLAPQRYDVITAIDTLVHIPDLVPTARMLNLALKPGGLLFANFDVRPKTPENAWHLYESDILPRWQLQRAGFEPVGKIDRFIFKYRKVEPVGAAHQTRGLRDALLLRSPLRSTYRTLRWNLRMALLRRRGG